MSKTTTKTLTFDEARDLCRSGDVAGAFMMIGERRYALRPIGTNLVHLPRTGSLADPDFSMPWTAEEVAALGAEFIREVPAHPHGLIPDERGAAIRCNGVTSVRHGDTNLPWYSSDGKYRDRGVMQALADEHGFTILGDVEAARAAGYLEGIRAIAERMSKITLPAFARSEVMSEFPEAFEETDQ